MGAKILIVDDTKMIRLMATKALKLFDCEVIEAANGVEGLAAASQEKPNVIVLDYSMPVMDGLEMLTKLKSDPELKSIPVIMLTAEAGRETVVKIAQMGVRDYLIKPFTVQLIRERVGRVIELKPKSEAVAKTRRFDERLNILVVDDKPAIIEQIKAGLSSTPWQVESQSEIMQALDRCSLTLPDAVLISLSLPDNTAYAFFEVLRADARTKGVPVFALAVRTAVEDQAAAQQVGFSGIVTKPIDFEDLKTKISRTLNLDNSCRYLQQRNGALALVLSDAFGPAVAHEVMPHLRSKMNEAVDAGLDKMILDLGHLKTADIHLIKLVVTTIDLCKELSLKYSILGSEAVRRECKKYQESKDWEILSTSDENSMSIGGTDAIAA